MTSLKDKDSTAAPCKDRDLLRGQGPLCKNGDPKGVPYEVCCSSSRMAPRAASTLPLPERHRRVQARGKGN